MKRILLIWTVTGLLLGTQTAIAQSWPAKPVRFISPAGAGGSSDQIARLLGDRLTQSLGQPFLIESRPGGNGVAGTAVVAKAAPDGYTFLFAFDFHATNPSLQSTLPYDTARDFEPIMLIGKSPFALAVNRGSPYRTLAELIAAAKSKPGELTLGTSGVGSRGHLAMLLIEQRADFKTTQAAYRGPAQVMNDLLGGQLTMQMGSVFFVAPFYKSQRVNILAVTSATRMTQLPEVPTVAELGFPGYEVQSWWGVLAPTGVPQSILARMHTELSRALNNQEARGRLGEFGVTVVASTPEEFSRFLAGEMQLWGKIVRDSKLKASE